MIHADDVVRQSHLFECPQHAQVTRVAACDLVHSREAVDLEHARTSFHRRRLLHPCCKTRGACSRGQSTVGRKENQVLELERETGFEPATLSLGMAPGESAGAVHGWQPSETRTLGGTEPTAASPGFATIRTREAPIEPHRTAQAARGGQKG